MVAEPGKPDQPSASASVDGTASPKAGADASGAGLKIGQDVMANWIVAVSWQATPSGGTAAGNIVVGRALRASFTAFILNGVMFSIGAASPESTTFSFSYSGPLDAQALSNLVRPGATIILSSGSI